MSKEDLVKSEGLLEEYKKLEKKYNSVLEKISELEKSNSARHDITYKYMPISIWEEDFSEVFSYLQSLNFTEIDDFESYINRNPFIITEALKKVKILEVNDFSAKLYKLDRKEDLIDKFEELFSESTLEVFKKELLAIYYHKNYLDGDAEIIDIYGEKHDIFLQWIVFPGYEKDYERIMVTTIDVTALKQAEKDRFRLIEQFEQENRLESLGLFASGIAHDFNNILSSLSGQTYLAMEKISKDHQAYENLARNMNLISKAKQVTNQILSFTSHTSNEKEIIEINKEIRKLKNTFLVFLENNTTLEFDLCTQEANITINPGQLVQIVLNLLINAVDATKEKGKDGIIVIKTEVKEKNLILTVRDNGSGIPEESLNKIFSPFFTTKISGRGLGLNVVQSIVHNFGGRISADSEIGKFTLFTVKLPLILNNEK